MLTVGPIDPSNWQEALTIRVSGDQLRFVADHQPVALVILAKAYIQPGDLDWDPLALMSDETLVGVAALGHAAARAECGLFHFVIDAALQGRGLGKLALSAIIDHIRTTHPHYERLWITVDPDNGAARHLYELAGFRSTGASRDGELVMVKTLRDSSVT